MYGYIAFSDHINATVSSDDDVFSYMAGGALDSTLAGGFAYNPFLKPSADFRSIMINNALSLSANIIGLNEDFAEFALMSIQIVSQRDREFNIHDMTSDIANYKKITDTIKYKLKNNNDKHLQAQMPGIKASKTATNFKLEVISDSYFENTLEQIGYAYLGPIGSAVAGMIYDGIATGNINGANVAEAIYGGIKNMSINTASKMIAKALGGSVVSANIATLALGFFVNELFETVTGLDNHFGFGGDFVGVDDIGGEIFKAPLSFMDGIKDTFGFGYGIDLIADKEAYMSTGQISGFKNRSGRYLAQIGDDVRSFNRYKEGLKEIEKDAKEAAEWMSKDRSTFGRNGEGYSDRFSKDDARGDTEKGSRSGLGASGGPLA